MQIHNTETTCVCTSLDVAGTFYSWQTTPLQQNKRKEDPSYTVTFINYLWSLSGII